MAPSIESETEARALADRILGPDRQKLLYPMEHGWLVREILTPDEESSGLGLGQGSLIIDRTGVVTAHPSLPLPLLMSEYTTARTEGRITGNQIWPPPTTPR